MKLDKQAKYFSRQCYVFFLWYLKTSGSGNVKTGPFHVVRELWKYVRDDTLALPGFRVEKGCEFCYTDRDTRIVKELFSSKKLRGAFLRFVHVMYTQVHTVRSRDIFICLSRCTCRNIDNCEECVVVNINIFLSDSESCTVVILVYLSQSYQSMNSPRGLNSILCGRFSCCSRVNRVHRGKKARIVKKGA
jgi:hypothetical protein